MESVRATWTDERLDDLARRMDSGFDRVDMDLRSLRADMNSMGAQLNGRIDALQRTMVQVGGGMTAAIVAGFLGVVATQL